MSKFDRLTEVVLRFVPNKVLRHYLYPFLLRKQKREYRPAEFFNSWYRTAPGDFSDAITISHRNDQFLSAYHYRTTESSILDFLARHGAKRKAEILDIGCGTGHWIDFYLEIMDSPRVCGLDISSVCVETLRQKYAARPDVTIMERNVADGISDLGKRFDIINAIGVMFHIVNDQLWDRAIANISAQLDEGGIVIVGGQFGWLTRSVQFHNEDTFHRSADLVTYTRFREILDERNTEILYNKKIRSLARWKQTARRHGLEFVEMIKTRENKHFVTPENNILILAKR